MKRISRNYFLFSESVLDSWGRIPSGILSGNLYDFGDFRRCFHLDRNGETYPTQYCVGKIIVDFDAFLTPDYIQKNAERQSLFQLIEFRHRSDEIIGLLNQ